MGRHRLMIASICLVFTFLLLWPMIPAPAYAENRDYTMSITGEASVPAMPDQTILSMRVSALATTTEEAVAQHSAKTAQMLAVIRLHGIAEQDVATTRYAFVPKYESRRLPDNSYKEFLVGYDVRQHFRILVRDTANVSSLISNLAPIVYLENVSFAVSDEKKRYEQAVQLAIENAVTRAHARANALGVNIVQVIGYDEGMITPVRERVYKAGEVSAMAQDTPQLPAGEREIRATVAVVFRIR